MKRPISTYVLFLLFLLQIINAIPAGIAMIMDPSGKKLGFTPEMLEHAPFRDFLIPGLFLLCVLGIFPIFILYGLIKKNKFKLAEKLNLNKNQHWSWTYSWYFGLLLILWINMQLLFLKEFNILHFWVSMGGAAIVFLTLLPSTKKEFELR